MNDWPECIDIWHETSLGQGYTSLFKWSSWGHKWPHLKGTQFYIVLYCKNL